MANVKKQLEEDFTNQPQATSAEDVNNQDARTRLYQSLAYSYGKQQDESDKAYDKAISQSNNAMLARGMQRSSYGGQIEANLLNEKAKARNDIGSALIADYQNRIGTIEQQEKEDERWERQFAETQKQNEWSRGFQEAESNRAQSNFEIQQAFNEKQFDAQQAQWREQFDYNKMSDDQKIAYNYVMAMLEKGQTPSTDLLARAGLSEADAKAIIGETAGGNSSYYRTAWEINGGTEADYKEWRLSGSPLSYKDWVNEKYNTSGEKGSGTSWLDNMGKTGNWATDAMNKLTQAAVKSIK